MKQITQYIIRTCPKCKKEYIGVPAISRKDNKTEICPICGVNEAINDYIQSKVKELAENIEKEILGRN